MFVSICQCLGELECDCLFVCVRLCARVRVLVYRCVSVLVIECMCLCWFFGVLVCIVNHE